MDRYIACVGTLYLDRKTKAITKTNKNVRYTLMNLISNSFHAIEAKKHG